MSRFIAAAVAVLLLCAGAEARTIPGSCDLITNACLDDLVQPVQFASSPIESPAPTAPRVDISNIVNEIIQGLGVMILSAVALWVRSHLNDAAAQKTVLTAAENAVAYAENRLGVKGDEPYTVPVASAIGRVALGYMNAHVADAAKRMGLDEEGLSRIIVAKISENFSK